MIEKGSLPKDTPLTPLNPMPEAMANKAISSGPGTR